MKRQTIEIDGVKLEVIVETTLPFTENDIKIKRKVTLWQKFKNLFKL